MTYNRAYFIIGVVLTLHAAGLIFGFYGTIPSYDIPMHFGGGFAMGALALAIWGQGVERIHFKGRFAKHLKWWLVPLFVLGFVALISIAWEVHEYALDMLLTDGVSRQLSIDDTMGDFLFDLSGGIVAILIYYARS